MPLSNLFFYKLLFIFEILAAELLFTFRLKKRNRFVLRFSCCVTALFVIAAFFPVADNSTWYVSFMFLVLFSLTLPMLGLCYAQPWVNVFFCGMAAYTTQHFAYTLANLALSLVLQGRSPILGMYDNQNVDFLAFDKQAVFFILLYLLCYVASYWLLYFFFGKRIGKGREMKIKNSSLLPLVAAGLLADIVLNAVMIYIETDFASALVNNFYSMLCCLLLLYCQFSLMLNKELKHELEFVNRIWHQEKEQYTISKENIDIINLKCHDMRHQIREIGKSKSIEAETIEQIERSIKLYDSMVKTGNEVLDIILTEKNLRCYNNGIVLTCVAEGEALGFMHSVDLYALFGNALDNAIEAVLKIENSGNRIIGLKIHTVGEMVTVNVKNSFDGELKFDEQGYPLTTKDDANYHGYGVKSIAHIVEKYDGTLSFVANKGVFNLNILLPVPSGDEV